MLSSLRFVLLFAVFAVSFGAPISDAAEPPARPHAALLIVLVGDSTVAPNGGWGPAFEEFLAGGATCANAARAGRSSKSFLAEGHWAPALALKGDYYLIQFGHNDQPGKGPERETEPATTYPANLARFVDEVRAGGGVPILVTSLTRRNFSATAPARIESTLTPYVDAVKRLAAEKAVPLVDLHARSLAYCERIGPEATGRLNPLKKDGTVDTTHLGAEAASIFAAMVVEDLKAAVPALAPFLRDAPSAARVVPPGCTFTADLAYGSVDGEELRCDAMIPGGAGPFPIVVLIHGGGWTGGSKEGDIAPLLAPLAEAGFACFSINYRLAPAQRWPACLEDVLTAIRWVKAHAAQYRGDPTRIALVGYSAGGQLACYAATVVDDSVRVQAVVGLAPLTDFVQELPQRGNVLGSAQRGLLNRPAELTPESLGLLRAISPIQHLRPGLPPFLLVHGDADRSVPVAQSVVFLEKVRAEGGCCELTLLPGAPHRLATWDQFLPDYRERIIAWLHRTMNPSTP